MSIADQFETKTSATLDRTFKAWKVVPLLVVIGLLIFLGMTATVSSFIATKQGAAASRADVRRNLDLIAQVKALQSINGERNGERAAAICEQLNLMAVKMELPATDCEVQR